MKMELEYPYSEDWKFGYIQINPEGRKTVILFKSSEVRSSTSYARYLMAVKEGRYLTGDEEADHVDTDHTNDDITNLQVLSIAEHRHKTYLEQSGETYCEFICPVCSMLFRRTKQRVTKFTRYCSLSCARKICMPSKMDNILLPEIENIKLLVQNGCGDNEISTVYNVHKSTIFNFRKKFHIKGRNEKIKDILKENELEIVKLRESGLSFNNIAFRFGLDKKAVLRFLRKLQLNNQGQ